MARGNLTFLLPENVFAVLQLTSRTAATSAELHISVLFLCLRLFGIHKLNVLVPKSSQGSSLVGVL